MKTVFRDKFNKDIGKLKDRKLKDIIVSTIENIEKAKSVSKIKNIKNMKGHPFAYRIRLGDYRIGIFIEKGIVEFARFLHRKNIYKLFP